jgi:hypothetical protein
MIIHRWLGDTYVNWWNQGSWLDRTTHKTFILVCVSTIFLDRCRGCGSERWDWWTCVFCFAFHILGFWSYAELINLLRSQSQVSRHQPHPGWKPVPGQSSSFLLCFKRTTSTVSIKTLISSYVMIALHSREWCNLFRCQKLRRVSHWRKCTNRCSRADLFFLFIWKAGLLYSNWHCLVLIEISFSSHVGKQWSHWNPLHWNHEKLFLVFKFPRVSHGFTDLRLIFPNQLRFTPSATFLPCFNTIILTVTIKNQISLV